MNEKGYFVTFEGLDGCGKSTLLQAVYKDLQDNDWKVKKISMIPDGILRDAFKSVKFCSKAQELLLARACHEEAYAQIRQALDEGYVVLCDRGPDSYYAYQGAGNQQERLVVDLENLINTEIKPDLTFYVKVDLQTSRERIQKRGVLGDTFEERDEGYHTRIKEYFDAIAREDAEHVENDIKRWPRIHVLDGELKPGLVAIEAVMKIEELTMRD